MIKASFFGRLPYLTGLEVQERIFQSLKQDTCDTDHFLCMFEHPPTYTVGIREHVYSPEEEQRIRSLGAEFHRVKRGGLITFHGPGQLVAYPVFNLRTLSDEEQQTSNQQRLGVRHFVHLVEEVLIQMLCQHFHLKNVGRTKNPGVWLERERKIAALGIQVRHGVTSHGLALNCSTDLSWFEKIVPCGLEGKAVTSLSRELGTKVDVQEAVEPLCEYFHRIFGLPIQLDRNARVKEGT